MAKARLETGENQQPFAHDTTYKTCLGCSEIKIPVADKLCAECDHVRKLQSFVNEVARLQSSDETTQAMILCAKPLVRE